MYVRPYDPWDYIPPHDPACPNRYVRRCPRCGSTLPHRCVWPIIPAPQPYWTGDPPSWQQPVITCDTNAVLQGQRIVAGLT